MKISIKTKPSPADQVRIAVTRKPKADKSGHALSTGCTLLNMALTGDPRRGFLTRHYYLLVGDSNSGKTFTSMTCFAEATQNEFFKNHRLIYDNIEDGMLMDVERLFGPEVERRLRPPAGSIEDPQFSETIEDFYYHVDDAIKKGKPFIYVLDSMDSLSSHDEQKKFDEQKTAHRAGKTTAGSYGDGKAKKNSGNLRKVLAGLRKTDSILIIICQTRDNLTGWGDPKSRSGGKSLRFYATTEIWTTPIGQIKKTVRGKERKIGIKVGIQTKKNRITGKLHEVETSIIPTYGIDDIGSCIDYLCSEGWWKKIKDSSNIKAGEFGTVSREKLVRIFDDGKFSTLRKEVAACWEAVEAACAIKRSARYG